MGEISEMKPGSVKGLHLVVAEIDAAREALVERGLAVCEITELGGVKYAGFSDPDGNSWLLQEFPPALRQPGQSFSSDSQKITVKSLACTHVSGLVAKGNSVCVRGGCHGQADLLGDHVARRLHCGRERQLRLGCAGRGGARFVNDLERPVGTYLYGRRMYETMVYWETAHTLADQPPVMQDFAAIWQAADKIVYSRTLETVSSARTRIERDFDPEAVRQMKAPRGVTSPWAVPTSPPRRSRPGWSTSATVRHAHRGGGRQTVPPQQRPPDARTAGRTPFRQRRGLPPLPHQDVRRRRSFRTDGGERAHGRNGGVSEYPEIIADLLLFGAVRTSIPVAIISYAMRVIRRVLVHIYRVE